MEGTLLHTIDELSKVEGAAHMALNRSLMDSLFEILEVRKKHALRFTLSKHDEPIHQSAKEGINWCNEEIRKILHITNDLK